MSTYTVYHTQLEGERHLERYKLTDHTSRIYAWGLHTVYCTHMNKHLRIQCSLTHRKTHTHTEHTELLIANGAAAGRCTFCAVRITGAEQIVLFRTNT